MIGLCFLLVSASPVPVSAHCLMARRPPCTIFSDTSCPLPPRWTCACLHLQTRTWAGPCSPYAAGALPSESSSRRRTSPSPAPRYRSSSGLVREPHGTPRIYRRAPHTSSTNTREGIFSRGNTPEKCHGNLCQGVRSDGFGLKYGKRGSARSHPKILCVLRLLLSGVLLQQIGT